MNDGDRYLCPIVDTGRYNQVPGSPVTTRCLNVANDERICERRLQRSKCDEKQKYLVDQNRFPTRDVAHQDLGRASVFNLVEVLVKKRDGAFPGEAGRLGIETRC